jgi:diguanylate cyclase
MGWNHGYRIAVNLSAAQFLRSDVRAMVATILAETGLPPNRLELEITEGMLIDNAEGAISTLNELRAMGIRLVLDDFGTGYSSLSYLQRLPFDKLKVDRSFVQRIETDEGSRAIVQAIIAMSSSLNLEVTAEGVETIEQFDLLRAQGCHEMQGYLLGRPMPKGDVDLLLHSYDSVLPMDVAVAAACVD